MKLLKELEQDNRNKILGLLLIALSLLFFISLVSIDIEFDHPKIKLAFTAGEFKALFSGLNNHGGVVGGLIAFMFFTVIGWFSLLIPVGLAVWGVNRFLSKDIKFLRKWTINIALLSLILMTLVSLPQGLTDFGLLGAVFGGWFGHILAKGFLKFFGAVFSYALLVSLLITAVFILLPSAFARVKNEVLENLSKLKATTIGSFKNPFKKKTKIVEEPKPKTKSGSGLLSKIIRVKKKKETVSEGDEFIPEPEIEDLPFADQIVMGGIEDDALDDETDPTKANATRKRKAGKGNYELPPLDIFNDPPDNVEVHDKSEFKKTAEILRSTLLTFGIDIDNGEVEIYPGPVITRFEFKPASGIKVAQIVNLSDDLALAMQAEKIRIVAPIPGKSAVGVEIPNKVKKNIYIKDIVESNDFQTSNSILSIALGMTIDGKPFSADIASMPHLLIAGSTGSGKSVCLNCVIASLVCKMHPDNLRFILVDPKRLELSIYDGLPHLERPVVTDMRDAEKLFGDAVLEMEDRYRRLARAGVRNIADFNKKDKDPLPYIVIIVDELADMMMSGLTRMETLITRLAQMARAVGIHLVLATQRPSVDVITGLIKANFSTRIAFQTATKIDSRTILDANGAEKLLGKGDMLFSRPGLPAPIRIHGAFISGEETEEIVEFISAQEYRTKPIDAFNKAAATSIPGFDPSSDPLYREAVEMVIRHKQGSVSLLQRRLGIGYQRAARLIDQLENTGVVGPYDGSKAREILVDETYLESEEFKK